MKLNKWCLILVLLLAAGLAGCNKKEKLEKQETLKEEQLIADKKGIEAIEIYRDATPKALPYNRIAIALSIRMGDGSTEKTRGFGKGNINWNRFTLSVQGATVVETDNDRLLVIQPDLSATDHHVIVKAVYTAQPSVSHEFKFPVRYDYAFQYYANGNEGSEGKKAEAGRQGTQSSPNGQNGDNGAHGQAARHGTSIDVMVKETEATPLQNRLLVLSINGTSYLVDPQGGSIELFANGGKGGNGGDGGDGGDAYAQLQNNQTVYMGYGGHGGHGGNGGDGGNGGRITLRGAAARKYSYLINTSSEGGKAGVAGRGGRAGRGLSTGGWPGTSASPGRDGITGKDGTPGMIFFTD